MIIADKLRIGDTIAFFSPSSPITANAPLRFERARRFLSEKGFKLKEGKLTGKSDYYRSGTIEERADELNSLIRDPEVKCIMSTIGGMNSNSLLPYIDYAQLVKTPKIIIGYSDVTAILLGIYAKTGLITYYGPALVASFGEMSPFQDMTFDYFSKVLIEGGAAPIELAQPPFWTDEFIPWETQDRAKARYENALTTIVPGVARGRIIGGNLNTFSGIWGSPYMPEIKNGDILFIEDSLKDIATVERSFSMLKVNGVFDRIAGLILGKHELFKDGETGRKPHEVLTEVMGRVNFPVLADFDCCHTHPMLTLPIGVQAELDATNKRVRLTGEY
jgi:muramoyltetrapeptide carboxypeptidase LdcA involved in peptidoglycan recycling